LALGLNKGFPKIGKQLAGSATGSWEAGRHNLVSFESWAELHKFSNCPNKCTTKQLVCSVTGSWVAGRHNLVSFGSWAELHKFSNCPNKCTTKQLEAQFLEAGRQEGIIWSRLFFGLNCTSFPAASVLLILTCSCAETHKFPSCPPPSPCMS